MGGMQAGTNALKCSREGKGTRLWRDLWSHKWLYIMLIPVAANFIIFHYIPFIDITIAFKKYNIILVLLFLAGSWKYAVYQRRQHYPGFPGSDSVCAAAE